MADFTCPKKNREGRTYFRMKRSTLIIIIVAATFAVIGSVTAVCGLAVLGFDLKQLSREKYSTQIFNVTEDVTDIYIEGGVCDIKIEETGGETHVEYLSSNRSKCLPEVKDGVLSVKHTDTRKWYEHIGFYFEKQYITVYLNMDEYCTYGSVTLKSQSGDINVKSGITLDSLIAESASGDINIDRQLTGGELRLKSASGDISINSPSTSSFTLSTVSSASGDIHLKNFHGGNISVESASGDAELEAVKCENLEVNTASGSQELDGVVSGGMLNLTSSSGDIALDLCDGKDIHLKAYSGDIRAVFSSGKIFTVRTSSGKTDYPDSAPGPMGGYCLAETASGDIKIRLRQ